MSRGKHRRPPLDVRFGDWTYAKTGRWIDLYRAAFLAFFMLGATFCSGEKS